MNPEKHETITFDKIVKRSKELGLTLPKSQTEIIKASIEEKKMTPEAYMEYIEKLAKRHLDKGYGWHIREDKNPQYPILYYIDKNKHISAYIAEKVNSETQEHFFVANRINSNNEHLKITSNNNLQAVKEHVSAYFTGATMKEMASEVYKKYQPKSQKTVPELSL